MHIMPGNDPMPGRALLRLARAIEVASRGDIARLLYKLQDCSCSTPGFMVQVTRQSLL